jgi:ribosomal protein S12 methylthiotransferase accessory factor
VFFGLVTDERNQSVAGGFGTNLDPDTAALKALFECVQNRLGQLPMGREWGRALYNEKAGRSILKPMDHGNAIRPQDSDFSWLTHLNSNLQLYLDPGMHRHLDTVRSGSRETRLPEILNRSSGDVNLDLSVCLGMLEEKGLDVIVTDLTHEDVAELGFVVLRVSIPGLVSNSVTAWPYLGNPRLYDVPAALGFPLKTERQMARFPMPYA